MTVALDKVYIVSEDIIDREIEDEIIIVPLTSGIGDMDDDLYTLNDTGKTIWQILKTESLSVSQIIDRLSSQYNESYDTIKNHVIELMQHLLEKGLILERQDR